MCEHHELGCAECLRVDVARLREELKHALLPAQSTSAALDAHGVFMREDVAPAVANFIGGLVKYGMTIEHCLPLAQTHLVWILQQRGGV